MAHKNPGLYRLKTGQTIDTETVDIFILIDLIEEDFCEDWQEIDIVTIANLRIPDQIDKEPYETVETVATESHQEKAAESRPRKRKKVTDPYPTWEEARLPHSS